VSTTSSLLAENLSVRFRKNVLPVVDSVSFAITPGTCCAIVGPNGAGKSTLLRALAGLMPGEITGRIALNGDDIARLPAREQARRRAFVPQDNAMPFAFTVREAITLGTPVVSCADELLAQLGLAGFGERSVLALSGGERQRVAIARAFVQNAPLLLLDEPTAHQDLRHGQRLLDTVRAFVRAKPAERAAIAVLHDLNLAAAWADTVLLLSHGRLTAQGSPTTVFLSDTLTQAYGTTIETHPFIRAASELPHAINI
jgi:iron complex transport system ATP-binding protein